jgi:pimeloyl-ACP methyl ester carboxylesterase
LSPLYYKEKGHGLPVILLHGFCETHAVWDHLVDHLAREYRVIAIDLPGFGSSELLPAPFTIDDVAECILNLLLKELKFETCVLLGHSLGGYIVLAMVEKKPELFSALGLINSSAYADSNERKLNRNKVMEFVSRHGAELFVRSFIPPLFYKKSNPHSAALVEHGVKIPPHIVLSYTKAMRDRPDRTHVLSAFTKPVLFLAGREDTLIPVKDIEQQVSHVKHSTLLILDNVSHMSFLEKEEESAHAIQNFIASIKKIMPLVRLKKYLLL